MADINKLRSLAHRLEKVTGPDREIDTDIAIMFKAIPKGFLICNEGDAFQRYIAQHDIVEFWQAPAYTASIDAAVSLVERIAPEYCWTVDSNGGLCSAKLFHDGDEGEDGWWDIGWHVGATPALAILRALVAALIAQAGDQ